MPLTKERRYALLRRLDERYQELNDRHNKEAPKNNTIPIGGGEWMDTFFRMEAIRGLMTALRNGKSVKESIEEGKTVSDISVSIWNNKREWQVHRCKETAHSFLERLVSTLLY